jgi:peptidyl-prolyl cis-trans isomerase C
MKGMKGRMATQMKTPRSIRQLMIAAVLCVAASTSAQAGESDTAAQVNDSVITRQRVQHGVEALMQAKHLNYGGMTNPGQYKELERQVLEELIAQELLWQEANRKGFSATSVELEQALGQLRQRYSSEEVFLADLRQGGFTAESYRDDLGRQIAVRHFIDEMLVTRVSLSNEEVRDAYAANQAQLIQPEQVNARHILIALPPTADDAAIAAARETIERVRVEAKAGTDFAELAKRHSQDSTAAKGGELGFASRGSFVKPFEDAAFALKAGELSDIVRTRYGFHVIKLEARREARPLTEAEATPHLRRYLASKKLQEVLQDEVKSLRAKGHVDVKLAS